MKKKLLIIVAVLILIALLFPIANLVFKPSRDGVLAGERPGDASFEAVAGIFEAKCAVCHVADLDLPFYASLPIASSVVGEDVREGIRFMDMAAAFDAAEAPISEVALAKLEHVLERGSMPPGRYLALHWDGGLGDEEKQALEGWIEKVRATYYASEAAAPAFRTEVVRPLEIPEDLDEKMVALGDRLYHDVRLSGDDTISCATCHDLAKGGTDQLRFSEGIGGAVGDINAPTVFNTSFNLLQFWDGRAADLKEQAGGPVTNPIEMGAEWPAVIEKLKKDAACVEAFGELFGDGITAGNVQEAIAVFEKSLVTPGSKFDRHLMGAAGVLSEEEKKGYDLFVSTGCATCHVGEALGGRSFELMGRYGDYFADRGEMKKPDHGRFNHTGKEGDRHKFKVPVLRNVSLTWPYFHDGSTKDLGEAVRTMARYQSDADLTDEEVGQIVVFLKTLSGTYKGKPLE